MIFNSEIREVEVETKALRAYKGRKTERFLKGPILMRQIALASQQPGQALAVFLAIHHQSALTGKPMVTISKRLLEELGISKDAKARGLRALEQVGLVSVERSTGRAARVGLLS